MPLGTSPPHTLDKGDYYYSLLLGGGHHPFLPQTSSLRSAGRPAYRRVRRELTRIVSRRDCSAFSSNLQDEQPRRARLAARPRGLGVRVVRVRVCVFAPLVLVFGRGLWGRAFIEKLSIVDSCSQVEAGDLRDASWPSGRVDESGIEWIDRSFHLRLTHPFSWELWAAASFVHLTCFPIPSTLSVLSKSKSGFKVRV